MEQRRPISEQSILFRAWLVVGAGFWVGLILYVVERL